MIQAVPQMRILVAALSRSAPYAAVEVEVRQAQGLESRRRDGLHLAE